MIRKLVNRIEKNRRKPRRTQPLRPSNTSDMNSTELFAAERMKCFELRDRNVCNERNLYRHYLLHPPPSPATLPTHPLPPTDKRDHEKVRFPGCTLVQAPLHKKPSTRLILALPHFPPFCCSRTYLARTVRRDDHGRDRRRNPFGRNTHEAHPDMRRTEFMDGTEVGILGNGKGVWRCVRVFTSSHLAKQKPCILSRAVVWQRNLSVFTFAIGHQNILPIST